MQTPLLNKYSRLYKLSIGLKKVKEGKQKVSFATWHRLVKQYKRALRKATSGLHPALKACGMLALSALLAQDTAAQCNTFQYADAINPIKHTQISPLGFVSPYFVDIDGDGDLDCYTQNNIFYYTTPNFFRNVGTNKLPVYQYEPHASGFQGIGLNLPTAYEQFVDIDGDGDYDCFLAEQYPFFGTFSSLHFLFFENVGTPSSPHFVKNEAKNPLADAYMGIYT